MPDPHVQALYYRLRSSPTEDFSASPRLVAETDEFELELVDDELIARPMGHYSTREQARDVLAPYLRDWEVSALLANYEIRFEYERSEMIDRDPLPGTHSVFAEGIMTSSGVASATVIRQNPTYPEFPTGFKQTALTKDLVDRFRRYLSQNDSLTTTAYWMLTKLETEFGSRKEARRQLKVSQQVLDTLGRLSSRADPEKGRKAKGDPTPLSPDEERWIRGTMTRLIRRTGELTDPHIGNLDMNDLPKLS